MSEDLKTIKELADELSVTKQNIQYHYQRLPKELQLKSSNGSNLINSKAEKIILGKVESSSKSNTKDQQIEKLTNDKNQHIIIGYEDENTGKIIGFVHAQMYESFYSDLGLNILGLAVNPDFQGRGIGRKLMNKLEDHAVDNNISFIRLNSALKREEAHKFYEHIGYTCDKVQKRFIKVFE